MKVLIIDGHPARESLIEAMANSFAKGVKKTTADIKIIRLCDFKIDVNPDLKSEETPVHNFVTTAQQSIVWADHIAWFYPTWWADIPAKLKAFLEQVFISGFAFKYIDSKKYVKWDKLLKGRTALLISTMDGPTWYYRFFVGEPAFKMMRYNLKFCGFKKVNRKYFGSVVMSNEKQRLKWLNEVELMGSKLH